MQARRASEGIRVPSCDAVVRKGGLPEHRSEHQAPRRSTRTIVPDAVAEPPSERSVFGEPARPDHDQRSAARPSRGTSVATNDNTTTAAT